jgi:hypothetical protein
MSETQKRTPTNSAASAQSANGPVALQFAGEPHERAFRIPYPADMKPRADRRFVDFSDTVRP